MRKLPTRMAKVRLLKGMYKLCQQCTTRFPGCYQKCEMILTAKGITVNI